MMRIVQFGAEANEITLLEALEPEQRADLQKRGRLRTYRSGAVLHYEGQLDAPVVVVLTGHVRVSALASDGRELVLAFRGPDAVLGELSALDQSHCSATVTAVDEVRAIVLTAATFNAFLRIWPEASNALLRLLAYRLRDADRKRIEFAALDTSGRVAARIAELAGRFGQPQRDGSLLITLPLSQEELATWVGSSREATVKALGQLRELGLVETGRRRLRVVDLLALQGRALA